MTGVPAHAAGGHGHRPPTPDRRGDRAQDPVIPPVRLWNVANALTMLRLLLVPGFVLLLLHGDGHDPAWRSFAWTAFAVAMITDLFDGELARRYNLVTDFGKIADPIADKAIMGAALIGLSSLGDLPWWVTSVILLREVGITLMRFWVIRHAVIPASRGGKLKTLTQGVAVGMYVLILTGPLASLRAWCMAAAVLLTVLTGLDYVRQAVVLRRRSLATASAPTSATAQPSGTAGAAPLPTGAGDAEITDGGADGSADDGAAPGADDGAAPGTDGDAPGSTADGAVGAGADAAVGTASGATGTDGGADGSADDGAGGSADDDADGSADDDAVGAGADGGPAGGAVGGTGAVMPHGATASGALGTARAAGAEGASGATAVRRPEA